MKILRQLFERLSPERDYPDPATLDKEGLKAYFTKKRPRPVTQDRDLFLKRR